MSVTKKNNAGKLAKKRAQTVIVIESRITADEILFPEKVARANKILSHTKFLSLLK